MTEQKPKTEQPKTERPPEKVDDESRHEPGRWAHVPPQEAGETQPGLTPDRTGAVPRRQVRKR